jgi:hypothetical protein
MEIVLSTDVLVVIMPPLVALTVFAGRYFWKKEKCFLTMKNKINSLSEHDDDSIDKHNGFDERLTKIETKQNEGMIYLKMVLKKMDIPYD